MNCNKSCDTLLLASWTRSWKSRRNITTNYLASKIHFKFDLYKYFKNLQYSMKQEMALKRQLISFENSLKFSQNVKEVIIELDLHNFEEMDYFLRVKEFLLTHIINKHKETIEKISFINCNLSFLLQKSVSTDDSPDLIEEFLLSLITPLSNLKVIGFVDRLIKREIPKESLCKRLFTLLQNKMELFTKIESLDLGLFYEFDCITTKKQKEQQDPGLFNFVLNLTDQISQLKCLQALDLKLKYLEFDLNQFSKLNNSILKCKNIESLKLDYSQERESKQIAINTLKIHQRQSNSLNIFEYNSSQSDSFTISEIKEFGKELSKLNKLQSISLQRLNLSPGCLEQLFQSLIKFTQLESLTLDMSQFNSKANEMASAFNSLQENSRFTLKSFEITFPLQNQTNLAYSTPVIEFVKSQKDSLQVLSYQYQSNVKKESFIELFENLGNLRNLTFFEISFYNSEELEHRISLNAKEKNVDNIFSIKTFELEGRYWPFKYFLIDQVALSYLLKYQNSLEKIDFSYSDRRRSQSKFEKILNQNYDSFSFKKLKTLILNYGFGVQLIPSASLVQKSCESLLHLKCGDNTTEDLYVEILKCKNLISLDVSLNLGKALNIQRSDTYLQTMFEKLVNLQSLNLTPRGPMLIGQITIDCSECCFSNYLTRITLDQQPINKINEDFLLLIKERYISILQQAIYFQQISPFLHYRPFQNHWDLLLESQ